MRLIDLSHFEVLTVPQNQGELLRALTLRTQKMSASRFAYVRLPTPFNMLLYGVYPRVLTNFPDHIVREYIAYAQNPFSMVVKALETGQPCLFSDGVLSEEIQFYKDMQNAGFTNGIIFPILNDSKDSAFLYFFNHSVDKSWIYQHIGRPMSILVELVDMAITGNTELCPQFVVPGLTDRVSVIMRYKAQGLTNQEIADELGVQPDSIKKAIKRFSERLGGLSTIELVYRLTKMGIL